MAEYTPQAEGTETVHEEFALRLRRAETLSRIGAESRFDRPIVEVLEGLAANIVQETRAISAALILMRPTDLSVIAQGGCNLPEGYLEGAAISNTDPERRARIRSLVDEEGTWVTRNARDHLLSLSAMGYMRDILEQVTFETMVTTAFLDRPETLGIITLYYGRDIEVDAGETAYAKSIAEQAAPVMDNAWLFNQIQERTEELEALSRADQAMHESILLENVYQAMIDLAVELFGADRSLFLTFDDAGRFHAAAARGVPEAELSQLQEVYRAIPRSRFATRTAELAIMEDIASSPEMNADVKRITSAVSTVDIPVFVQGTFFGLFVLSYYSPRKYSAEDRRLFNTLAGRASLAIQNALLFKETQRRTSELEALSRADQALHESLVLEDVYRAMIDLSIDLLGADHSLFLTFDDAGVSHAAATRGVPAEHLLGLQPIYAAVPRSRFNDGLSEVVVVEDIDDNGDLLPGAREFTNSRSTVDVNVFIGGKFFGMFVLGYHTRRSFTDGDRSLFGTLSARAGMAIQNALLFKETQRRTNELEALSRADQAMHESIHLENVFRAMIDLAVELFGADSSLFLTFNDSGRFHAAATRGVDEAELAGLQVAYDAIKPRHFDDRTSEPIAVEDVAADPNMNPQVRASTSAASAVDISVFVGGKFFGSFVLGYMQRRTFSEDDRRMFRTLASRAGLAIQNALQFSESRRRTAELEALYHADEALHRSLRIDDVLEAMVDLAVELLGATSSLVVTWDETDHLAIQTTRGIGTDQRQEIHQRYQQFPKEYFTKFDSPYRASLIEDVGGHPKIDDVLKRGSPGSLAEIPVIVGEELWGFFSIGWRTQRTFNDDDRRLFDAFAARASLAIQNANLFEQAQVSASLEERQRIARELHDSVSQALYGIGLGGRTAKRRLGPTVAADVLEPLDYIIQLAESGLAETRALIFELIPESLEEQGLVLALQRQAAATQSRYRVEVEAFLGDEPEIPIRAKEALYRIAQESLHNMAKHAEATHASIGLYASGGVVTLVVRDDGKGFDTGAEFPGHFGLRSMEERAKRIGGTFVIESTPGQGTTATVTLPALSSSASPP